MTVVHRITSYDKPRGSPMVGYDIPHDKMGHIKDLADVENRNSAAME